MTDTRPQHAAKGIRFIFLGKLLVTILFLIDRVNLTIGLGFGVSFDASNIWYGLAGYIGPSIIIYGLFLIYRVNRYFKVTLMLHIPLMLVWLATLLYRHSVITFVDNDIITSYIPSIISLAAFFSVCWGMASIAEESGLTNLAKRFKRLFRIYVRGLTSTAEVYKL